jgi:uncharacterized membrane protein
VANAENTVIINRPVDDVFAFLANAENDPQWRKGVLDIQRVSGEGAGARYRQGMKGPLGRRLPADIEITEYRPNELIAFRATEGPVHPEGRYELSEIDGGTRVRFRLDADLPGAKKLMAPMVQRQMQNEVSRLQELKRVLEAHSA